MAQIDKNNAGKLAPKWVFTMPNVGRLETTPVVVEGGRGYMGGNARGAAGEMPRKILRAIDIQTGAIAWELPQTGSAFSSGGTLATVTGLVFFGADDGMFAAVDATTGKLLWQFQTNQNWRASPMTYVFDGRQYVAVASGQNILAFGLVPRPFDLFLNASGRACPAPTPALVGARHASPPRRMLPRGQERNHAVTALAE